MGKIIGKYEVVSFQHEHPHTMLTDNPREAIWEANKYPMNVIMNICGDKEFYKDKGAWRFR